MIVYWELTNACGLACRHCRATAMPDPAPGELSTAEAIAVLDDIATFGTPLPHVVMTGGDPLRRGDLRLLIAEANARGIGVSLAPAVTPLLTFDRLAQLKADGVQAISLSLDGSSPDRHDGLRGVPGTFEATMTALGWAADLELPVQVNTLVTATTATDLPAIYELLSTRTLLRWSLFFLISVGRGTELTEMSPGDAEKLMGWLLGISRRAPFQVKTTEATHYRRVAARALQQAGLSTQEIENHPMARGFGIRDGNGIVFISHTGDVTPSGFLPLALGNVRDTSLVELYRQPPDDAGPARPVRVQGTLRALRVPLLVRRLAGPGLRLDRGRPRVRSAVPLRPAWDRGTGRFVSRVLVVGGGIAGLAAAWEASRRGAEVFLVEASPRFGGKLLTERTDGFTIEHGPDSFVSYRPAALQLAEELGMADEVIEVAGTRTVHMRSRGRLQPLPAGMGMVLPTRLGPFVTTGILSWTDKIRAGLDLVLPRRLGEEDVAIGSFLRARLGEGVVRRFADPMVGGIYGASVDELSLDAVLPSLRENERSHRSLMLASLAQGRAARARQGGTRGPSSPFRSLRRGLGSLPERLVTVLNESGAHLYHRTVVEALESDGTTTLARLTGGRLEDLDAVVLAGGVESSADLLDAHAPTAAAALRAIPLASSTVVTLAYPDSAFREPPATHGWLEADPAPISGVTVSSAKWAGRAPQGEVLLRAFVPARLGAIARAGDAELLEAVTGHVAGVLGAAGTPDLVRISRWSQVMPTYTVGHLDKVAAVEDGLGPFPSWQVAGSALRGVGVPDCIADGRRAAAAVVDSPTIR